MREDRQIRVETILKYSNYNIKADELLVGLSSKHLHCTHLPIVPCLLNPGNPCLESLLNFPLVMCLDVLMSRVLDLGDVIGSPGSCLARVRFRTTQELTIDRQLLLGLHQLRKLLFWCDTKIASHVYVVGPND